jgi:nucleoid DNA-binding protein
MQPSELIKMLASKANVPDAAAADEIGRLVTRILRDLRRGAPVSLPGIGTLQRAAGERIEFRPAQSNPARRRQS